MKAAYLSLLGIGLLISACGSKKSGKKDDASSPPPVGENRNADDPIATQATGGNGSLAFELGFPIGELEPTGAAFASTSSSDPEAFMTQNNDEFINDDFLSDEGETSEDDEDAAEETEKSSSCISQMFDKTIQASGAVIKSVHTVDLTECMNEAIAKMVADAGANSEGNGGAVNGRVVRYLYTSSMYIRCDGADFSSLNGLKFKQFFTKLKNVDVSACNGDNWGSNSNKSEMIYSRVDDGVEMIVESTSWEGEVAGDGGPCRDGPSGTHCIQTSKSINKTTYVRDGQTSESAELTFKRTKLAGVTFSPGKPYAQGAAVEVQYGDWMGTVTLFDGERQPEWSFVRNGETVSGKISL